MISIRWFVDRASPPESRSAPSGAVAHAHPPGPGFPWHAPSVYTVEGCRGCAHRGKLLCRYADTSHLHSSWPWSARP